MTSYIHNPRSTSDHGGSSISVAAATDFSGHPLLALTEMLLEIFTLIPEEAWTLTQVCTRWRAVGLSWPFLWTEIKVVAFPYPRRLGALTWVEDPQAGPTTFAFHFTAVTLQMQLQRSGSQPLRITFHLEQPFGADPKQLKIVTGLYGILAGASARWRTLKYHGPSSIISVFPGIRHNLLLLELLDFEPLDRSSSAVFEIAPRLRTVIKKCWRLGNHYPLPYSQLVKLQMSGVEWEGVASILVKATSVQELELSGLHHSLPPSGTTISMNALRRMTVGSSTVLHSFHLLVLVELTVDDIDFCLKTFVSSYPNCPLQMLKVYSRVNPEIFHKVAPLLSLLVELIMTLQFDQIEEVAGVLADPELMPVLEKIVFHVRAASSPLLLKDTGVLSSAWCKTG
ncbi:hypothetical protein C8J57DRAFT_1255320 [Mycena rebaudengoi]|nr:hypothetical protein C8J57DRAFT_1255320 [Mycena rebaudengoi]